MRFPSIDMRTASLVMAAVTFVLTLTMLFLWKTRRTCPGFGMWTAGHCAATSAYALVALRGLIPDLLSIIAANLLFLLDFVLFFGGIRLFREREVGRKLSAALFAVLLVSLLVFTYVRNDLTVRIVVISIVLAVIASRCAFELVRGTTPKEGPTLWLTGALFGVFAALMSIRAVVTFAGTAQTDFLSPDRFQGYAFLAYFFLGIGWAFCFVALNSERLEAELWSAHQELARLVTTDFLTGLHNDRSFHEIAELEIARSRRGGHPMAVAMLDIDRFKEVNDRYGHAAGNAALKALAAVFRKELRGTDTTARLGGDEFAVLLPETGVAEAHDVLERVRKSIAETVIGHEDGALKVTVSIGVSATLHADETIQKALGSADEALYAAKRTGGDRTLAAPSRGEAAVAPSVPATARGERA